MLQNLHEIQTLTQIPASLATILSLCPSDHYRGYEKKMMRSIKKK